MQLQESILSHLRSENFTESRKFCCEVFANHVSVALFTSSVNSACSCSVVIAGFTFGSSWISSNYHVNDAALTSFWYFLACEPKETVFRLNLKNWWLRYNKALISGLSSCLVDYKFIKQEDKKILFVETLRYSSATFLISLLF